MFMTISNNQTVPVSRLFPRFHELVQQSRRLKQMGTYQRPDAMAHSLKKKGLLALLVSQGHLGYKVRLASWSDSDPR